MNRRMNPPAAEVLEKLRQESERQLSKEEFEAYVNAPWDERDLEETLALIRWFCRRYPTPGERLASARRAYQQWARSIPSSDKREEKHQAAA